MIYFQFENQSDGSAPISTTTIAGSNGSSHSDPLQNPPLKNDRWYLIEEHVTNTSLNVWVDGVQQVTNYTYTLPGSNPTYQYFNMGIINMALFVSEVDITNWVDGLAISTSRIYASSLIEISGDGGSTWKYQPPTSLSDTSITVTTDLPTLTASYYKMRVTNNGQTTSAAYNLLPTPTITNVTGTVSTGQTLTITGTNMVQEDNTNWFTGAPNFKSSAYRFEGANPLADNWWQAGYCDAIPAGCGYPNCDPFPAGCNGVYTTDVKLMGNKSLLFSASGASCGLGSANPYGGSCPQFSDGNGGFQNGYITNYISIPQTQNIQYTRAYVRIGNNSGVWPDNVFKMFDFAASGNGLYIQPRSNGELVAPTFLYDAYSNPTAGGLFSGGSIQSGRWYAIEVGQNTSTGTVSVWMDNQL